MRSLLVAGVLVAGTFVPTAHADPPICTIRGCVEQVCRDYGIESCPL